jgi:nicotinate-nucleotide pyrophosphorylase
VSLDDVSKNALIIEASADRLSIMIRNPKQIGHPSYYVAATVTRALEEDRAGEDVTTLWTVPSDAWLRGYVEARTPGVIAGLLLATEVFRQIDTQVMVRPVVEDGDVVGQGEHVLVIEGPA